MQLRLNSHREDEDSPAREASAQPGEAQQPTVGAEDAGEAQQEMAEEAEEGMGDVPAEETEEAFAAAAAPQAIGAGVKRKRTREVTPALFLPSPPSGPCKREQHARRAKSSNSGTEDGSQ